MATSSMSNCYCGSGAESYTYPQFVINEKTGRMEGNLIDGASGRIVRHIPSVELDEIIRNQAVVWTIDLRKHYRISTGSNSFL